MTLKIRFKHIALLISLLSLSACGSGGSSGGGAGTPQPTNLDTSFGTNGKVVTEFFSGERARAWAMAIDGNGKIVVAGQAYNGSNLDFALARYNTDGTLDTSFNGPPFICVSGIPCNGTLVTDFNGSDDAARAIAIQPNGKIVVAGTANNGIDDDFALARYNADGSLDTGFGIDGTGKITTGFFSGENDRVSAIALQTDGKIVVAGQTSDNGDPNFALARYLP